VSRLSVCLFLAALLSSAASIGGDELHTISGEWSDACPCGIPCHCWKHGISSARRCVNFHVFRVESGLFKGVDLTGTVFVLLNVPRTPGEAPSANTLIVDANSKKSALIESGFQQMFGFAPPNIVRAQIRYSKTKDDLLP
jgi:Protein of unknown function (DUF1326)